MAEFDPVLAKMILIPIPLALLLAVLIGLLVVGLILWLVFRRK